MPTVIARHEYGDGTLIREVCDHGGWWIDPSAPNRLFVPADAARPLLDWLAAGASGAYVYGETTALARWAEYTYAFARGAGDQLRLTYDDGDERLRAIVTAPAAAWTELLSHARGSGAMAGPSARASLPEALFGPRTS